MRRLLYKADGIVDPTRTQRGATLISAMLAMFLLTVAMTIVLQSYVVGSRASRLSAQRNAVTLALQSRLEAVIAGEYGQLPSSGARAIPVSDLPALSGIHGQLLVAKGMVPGTSRISAQADWVESGPRQERLTIVMVDGRRMR